MATVEQLQVAIAQGHLAMARTQPNAAPRAAVLLIHGFAQNRFAWDLPGRSLPKFLAARGYDVFNLELRGHGHSRELGAPHPRSFEDYVDGDMLAALDRLARLGYAQTFLIGHSLGGAIAYAVAGSWPERVQGVVTLSGMYRWGSAGPWLRRFIGLVHRGGWAGRALGVSAAPTVRLDVAGKLLSQRLTRTGGDALPVPLQAWYPGSIERDVLVAWLERSLDRTSSAVLAQMARWAMADAFCDRAGRRDYAQRWRACGRPVLVIAADRDRFAHPLHDVKPAFDASSSADRGFRLFGRDADGLPFGHVDLVVGKHAPELVWPAIGDWLDERAA